MSRIVLKKYEDKRLRQGHLWIFSNEISETDPSVQNGDIVKVYDSGGVFLASAFYNKNSLIAARIISRGHVNDTFTLFRNKIAEAEALRKRIYPERKAYRLLYSEGDYLPGLIIDRYNYGFVLQINSAGIERNKTAIAEILARDYSASFIVTRNDKFFRELENLPVDDETLHGNVSEEIIYDGAVSYKIDLSTSQKTGFYFDQAENRIFTGKLSRGLTVLDLFCNQGGFGLNALAGGAVSADFLDSSADELKKAEKNYQINGFRQPVSFIKSEAQTLLKSLSQEKKKYGLVICDPPAFAKRKKDFSAAKQGYFMINSLAIRCIEEGGFLATASCSHHMPEEEFYRMVRNAALKEGRTLQLIRKSGAAPDHPVNPNMPETFYLKFSLFKVI
ncbi:MAG: class I SAM-dependent rRNA methyltransferase [Ignavibacteriaceae bacterium]|nr:class I SAM-dependent rRNA methyltransferase [Ignavibacteriaceae bacterium]